MCLVACKKQDAQIAYIGLLTNKTAKIVTPPKIYTKNGEITDQAIVNSYLNRLPTIMGTRQFITKMDTVINWPSSDSIKFITADTVVMTKYGWGWNKRVVNPIGNYLYLNMLDTAEIYEPNYISSSFDIITKEICIYKPYIKANCFYSYCLVDTYEAQIVKWHSDKLILPVVNYLYTHTSPNGATSGRGVWGYNNLFNPSIVNFLLNTDTLVVQTMEREFEKVR